MKNLNKIVLSTLLSAGLMGTAFVAHADNKNRSQDTQAISSASVSINKAVEIALAAVPGAATEAEFEVEDGKSIWEVEVLDANKQMYKVEIDANSGDVLEKKLDDGNENFQPSNLEVTSVDVNNPAHNVIPAAATAKFNVRFNTEHDGQDLLRWIEREIAGVEKDFDGEIEAVEDLLVGGATIEDVGRHRHATGADRLARGHQRRCCRL